MSCYMDDYVIKNALNEVTELMRECYTESQLELAHIKIKELEVVVNAHLITNRGRYSE